MRTWIAATLAALVTLEVSAETPRMLTVVGYLEEATILPGGLPVKAKMDTGADVTSIHAVDIRRYKKNGEDWVQFTVDTGNRRMTFRQAVERIIRIRRAGTGIIERPVVRLGICIAGYYKRAQVNLADRSNMRYSLLVGRRFMSTGEY